MADGQVVFEISADARKAKAAINDTTAALTKAGKDWEKAAGDSTGEIGGKFTDMFKKIGVAAAAAKVGQALLNIGKEAVQLASDLQEVQNVVDTVFGDGASEIESWSQTAQTQFGLTEIQAKRFTSTLGAMMKSSGLAGPEIVSMSEDLAGLAADMASFYNLDFDTAFQKIRSGISGETEPLKQLGINMSVANLEAYALTQGITKAFDKMSQGEQTLLRYQYLMQATGDAQGDFARTSETSFANMQRTLETNLTMIQASIGNLLIGPLTKATGYLNDFLEKLTAPKKETILDKLNNIEIKKDQKIAEIQAIAAEALSLTETLDSISSYSGITDKSSVIVALNTLTDGLSGLGEKLAGSADMKLSLEEVAQGLSANLAGDPDKWKNLLQAIKNNAKGAIGAVSGDEGKTKEFLTSVAAGADDLTTDYSPYWTALLSALGDNAEDAISALADGGDAGEILGGIAGSANTLNAGAGGSWQRFVNALDGITTDGAANLGTVADALSTNIGGDADKWKNLLQAIKNDAAGAISAVSGDSGKTKAFLTTVAEGADDLTTDYSTYWSNLLQALGDNAADAITALAEGDNAGTALGEIASGANSLNGGVGNRWNNFIGALGCLIGADDVPTNLQGVANALATNIGGSANKWETLLTTIGTKLAPATNAVKGDNGQTASFMETAAAAADDLGADYSGLWNNLLEALGSDNAAAAVQALQTANTAGNNLENIAKGANLLNASSSKTWGILLAAISSVDGMSGIFNNNAAGNVTKLAAALSGDSLDTSKAEAWQTFLGALQVNPEALSQLTGESATDTAAWLSTMADAAAKIDPTDADAWNTLLTSFVSGLPGLGEGNGDDDYINRLLQTFLAMGTDSEIARAGLTALGMETNDITAAQDRWLKICQQLVKTIPGLSSIINTQTGEVKGGTQAIKDYINSWSEEQILQARINALKEKRDAIRAEAEIDHQTIIAEKRAKAIGKLVKSGYSYESASTIVDSAKRRVGSTTRAEINAGTSSYEDFEKELQTSGATFIRGISDFLGITEKVPEASKEASDAMAEYAGALYDYNDAQAILPTITASVNEEIAALEAELDKTAEELGITGDEAKETAEDMTTLQKAANGDEQAMNEVTEALKNAEEAFKALADYQEKVREEVAQTVKSTVSGFSKVETPMQKARKDLEDLKKDIGEGWEGDKRYTDANGAITSLKSMTDNLQSQLDFMKNYQAELDKARANGVSEDILSMLSDGSQESYDYLYAINHTAGSIEDLNEKYAQVQAESEKFTDSLTQQKLATDDVYKSLVDTANEAIAQLNLSDAAKQSVQKTVEGIAAGLAENKEKVTKEVDAILAQLARLGLVSYNAFTGTGYGVNPFNSEFRLISRASQANGIDNVPFDGYLALLHQGERVQTAAEADLSRRYSYQQPAFDYNLAGSAMWANAPKLGGGNVYLDGQVVGRVMSAQQANAYRALERSGWQA